MRKKRHNKPNEIGKHYSYGQQRDSDTASGGNEDEKANQVARFQADRHCRQGINCCCTDVLVVVQQTVEPILSTSIAVYYLLYSIRTIFVVKQPNISLAVEYTGTLQGHNDTPSHTLRFRSRTCSLYFILINKATARFWLLCPLLLSFRLFHLASFFPVFSFISMYVHVHDRFCRLCLWLRLSESFLDFVLFCCFFFPMGFCRGSVYTTYRALFPELYVELQSL